MFQVEWRVAKSVTLVRYSLALLGNFVSLAFQLQLLVCLQRGSWMQQTSFGSERLTAVPALPSQDVNFAARAPQALLASKLPSTNLLASYECIRKCLSETEQQSAVACIACKVPTACRAHVRSAQTVTRAWLPSASSNSSCLLDAAENLRDKRRLIRHASCKS